MTSFTVEWGNEKHSILLITLSSDEWTVEDMLDALGRARELVEAISHPYVTIADMRHSNYTPPNLLSNFPRIINAAGSYPNDTGTIVVFSPQGMNKIASEIFSNVVRKLTIAHTIEEAYQIAEERL